MILGSSWRPSVLGYLCLLCSYGVDETTVGISHNFIPGIIARLYTSWVIRTAHHCSLRQDEPGIPVALSSLCCFIGPRCAPWGSLSSQSAGEYASSSLPRCEIIENLIPASPTLVTAGALQHARVCYWWQCCTMPFRGKPCNSHRCEMRDERRLPRNLPLAPLKFLPSYAWLGEVWGCSFKDSSLNSTALVVPTQLNRMSLNRPSHPIVSSLAQSALRSSAREYGSLRLLP